MKELRICLRDETTVWLDPTMNSAALGLAFQSLSPPQDFMREVFMAVLLHLLF